MPPSLSRGASKEQVDIVRGQMQALDHSIKKLSREGSTLKAELDASDLAQVSGKPLTKLTMREIFELSHKRAPQVAPEIPKSAWGELGHVYTADDVHYKKKTMREIAAEAQAEEAAKIEAERQRLLALRHSSSKHIGGARGGPKSLLSAWDDRYEEDATQVRPLGHHGGELQSSSKHLSTRSLTHSSASLGASSQSRSSGLDVRSMPRSSGVDDSDSARMSSRISRVSMPRVSETVGGSSSSALPLDEPEPTPGGRTRTRRRAVATVTLEGALGVATRSHHGIEWETRVLPLLEDTVSSCGADHASLAHLNPSAAFVAAYRLIMRRDPSDPPAPQASTETVKNYDARAAVQASTRALILPRGGQETEDDYRMRLDAFKRSGVRGGMQRAGTSKASMATLVFPKGAHEKGTSFAERLKLQEASPFVVLPRDASEGLNDYRARLDAIGEARSLWMGATGDVPAPLLLARGRAEEEALFVARLDRASTPPAKGGAYCTVTLPQAEGEEEVLVIARLDAQARTGKSLLPFDSHLETPDDCLARLKEV